VDLEHGAEFGRRDARRRCGAARFDSRRPDRRIGVLRKSISGSPAMGPTPLAGRQISRDHAHAIAETGGSIGIWHFFPSLDKYVDGLKEMAEIVGVDHVSIGTDQQVAPGRVQDYGQWVELEHSQNESP
jgi:hypothetical protein